MISCFAATSMPRVGSSRISMRGSVASQRASSAFCWLPPESSRIGMSMLAARMPSAAMKRSASAACSAGLRKRHMPRRACSASDDVLAQRQLGDDAFGLAVLGHRADAVADRLGGLRETHASPSMRRMPLSATRAPNSRRASSVRPDPSSPARPTTSPARSVRSTGAIGRVRPRPSAWSRLGASAGGLDRRRSGAGLQQELAPEHRRDQCLRAELGHRPYSPTQRPLRSTVTRSDIAYI